MLDQELFTCDDLNDDHDDVNGAGSRFIYWQKIILLLTSSGVQCTSAMGTGRINFGS
jgi:hypothetical protein